ncbi:monocarboxylate transporter [Biomphalaria glabrata]|uniref:Uncharacterized protein LOC106069337 n=1 Tax=Biomphalaria glabrata TaxID=6526 RepID=A0A9W3B3S8_BIOGL|nr:uncharacterized protein LOC106069337 [Biomphalaria glabrata]XP_013084430.2 uncharacterized protein LOC106069337 [Biomphalaria glabrata]XP_013084431.2 uncharacterized protein LOC106069337 [Biomphalaria glabrata]XP_055894176.1 uncharacterized protein LOC106069337 [Biomphalaria glabrata]XP_055894177.1 uncharacterized protein LOC106069337 [Biomphalaria glabrata]XP_055894178.1 uncharacterized protein LOC106069337 [Biomphalaria glabrata]XP_055894179.1 uncharacterized protein LOC106069337 [Biomph
MTKAEVYIPDGGWGWVIVTCSFLIHMFVVGTMYALSVIYVAWLDYFDSGKGLTSWIVSLAVAVMFGIGPVPGALSKRFGNQAVVIMGSIVMCIGFFISYFAVNVYVLIVTIGIIAGFGAGCCYLPSVSMVAMYFTTKRSIAMGIASSGLGAGAFFMAPFINWIVDYYGWRGSMFILGGISLNMCVLGALMRPLEKAPRFYDCHLIKHKEISMIKESPTLSRKSFDAGGDCARTLGNLEKYEKKCEEACREGQSNGLIRTCRGPNTHLYSILPAVDLEKGFSPTSFSFTAQPGLSSDRNKLIQSPYPLDTSTHTRSLDRFGRKTKCPTTLGQKSIDIAYQPKPYTKQKGRSLEALRYVDHTGLEPSKHYTSELELRSRKYPPTKYQPENQTLSLTDFQIMLSGSLGSFAFLDSAFKAISVTTDSRKHSFIVPATKGSISLLSNGEEQVICSDEAVQKQSYCSSLFASLDTYIDLICSPTFLLFGISNFLTNLSFFMPVLYMVDRAKDSGIEKSEAAMLISLYGAGNIFGKVFFGWLADRELVNRLFYYILVLTVCGVSTCISPLCGASPVLHSIYAFVFGCFIGAYATLVSIVTVDLMGLAVVGEAFGLLLSFMGIATALGTPVAGWIFDWTGSYTISFVLHGIFILVSALMLIPLLVLKRNQTKK